MNGAVKFDSVKIFEIVQVESITQGHRVKFEIVSTLQEIIGDGMGRGQSSCCRPF